MQVMFPARMALNHVPCPFLAPPPHPIRAKLDPLLAFGETHLARSDMSSLQPPLALSLCVA
jgi:hypothetical protein